MASWSPPTIHATGDDFSITDNNTLANNETFLYQRPVCNYFNSVATSLPDSTITSVTLGGTTYTAYGFSVTGGTTIVFPLAGNYWVTGQVFINISSGYCQMGLYQNGSQVMESTVAGPSAAVVTCNVSGALNFPTASGTLSMLVTQTSGSTVPTANSAVLTYVSAAYIGSS